MLEIWKLKYIGMNIFQLFIIQDTFLLKLR